MSDIAGFAESESSPGLAAFDALRAEQEPWLKACFVPPSDFPLIAGARSVILWGEEGSGKTALYHMLLNYLRPNDRPRERLVVEWRLPHLEPNTPIDSSTAELVAEDMLAACCAELSLHLTRQPDRFAAAPADIRNTITWFLQHYPQNTDAHSPRPALQSLNRDEFLERADLPRRISELTKALKEIGLTGVCILAAPEDSYTWPSVKPG